MTILIPAPLPKAVSCTSVILYGYQCLCKMRLSRYPPPPPVPVPSAVPRGLSDSVAESVDQSLSVTCIQWWRECIGEEADS